MTNDSPLAAIITPSVATNGGTFILEIVMPFANPGRAPVSTPPSRPRYTGRPQFVTNSAAMTADSVMTVPTDRSIPAVIMTKVAPSASTPLTVVASKILITLSTVKKHTHAHTTTT